VLPLSPSFIKKLFGRRAPKVPEEKPLEESVKEEAPPVKRYTHILYSLQPGYSVLETYPVYEPFAYINIVEDPEGRVIYEVQEASLTPEEERLYNDIKEHLIWELKPISRLDIDVASVIKKTARRIISEFQIKMTRTPSLTWAKIMYYIERDIIGYGVLDPIFRDPYIEDISCNGPRKPVYVWHRRYESIPTNIVFESEEELDNYVVKLAHMAGKHISVAYPVLDAIIPGGHRLAATFKRETSTSGSTFTIRKFTETPLTIVDLLNFGNMSPQLAAYFWLAMDYKLTTLILGVTGAGKTTVLNALATLLRPTYKIVTIEDTPELRLPHENWVQLVSRPSFVGSGVGEISLFHLVKLSLRYRPDVIIVGEVRGEEAYVLFQAVATGHSGMTSIHAEYIDAAVKRLTSPPMNIPESYIPLINLALVVKRVQRRDEKGRIKPVRRVTNVWEIWDFGDYREVFTWNPLEDRHEAVRDLHESLVVRKVREFTGLSEDEILAEMDRRRMVLEWLMKNKITAYRDVALYIHNYYKNPASILEKIKVKV
jgi:flagellar protein FlaI